MQERPKDRRGKTASGGTPKTAHGTGAFPRPSGDTFCVGGAQPQAGMSQRAAGESGKPPLTLKGPFMRPVWTVR